MPPGTPFPCLEGLGTGLSKPVTGSAIAPEVSLDVSASSLGAGTLSVWFSDDGFGPLAAGKDFVVDTSLTSLANGSVTWSTYGDVGNTIFGNDLLHAQSSLTTSVAVPSGQTQHAPAGGPIAAPYSLTAKIMITHTAAGSSNPDMVLHTPDGGTTLALLGGSLLGLGAIRRKLVKA